MTDDGIAPKMKRILFGGTANSPLAEAVATPLNTKLGACRIERFPDGEIHVEILEEAREGDVFILQPLSPPVAHHLLELLLMADACRRGGARRVTAVVPYLGYARQDRRARQGEAVAARLVADLLKARVDRLVALDLHNPAIEGFFDIPVEHVSAVEMLAHRLRPTVSRDSVLVAPDLGAVKRVQRYADHLDLPVSYAQKVRISPRDVSVHHVIGNVEGRSPILVDDMISTGNTLISAIEHLLERGCNPRITVAATHGLFVEDALNRLSALPVERILVTDSVPGGEGPPSLPLERVPVGPLLAGAVARLDGA
jgi:ribose-phosphate pyrophosphokinase